MESYAIPPGDRPIHHPQLRHQWRTAVRHRDPAADACAAHLLPPEDRAQGHRFFPDGELESAEQLSDDIRFAARALLRRACSLSRHYREPLKRRPGILNLRLEHGVGLLP
jgi:hypothetical protein